MQTANRELKAIVFGTGRMARGIAKVLSAAYPSAIGVCSKDMDRARATIDAL